MKRTILIPTDFTVQSLSVIRNAMTFLGDTGVSVLLVHGIFLPDSIPDLLFFSKTKLIQSLETDEFVWSCGLLRNRFQTKIDSLEVDIFTGINVAAFNNYLEANRIHEAFIPENYRFLPRNKRSFDIIPFIQKSSLSITRVPSDELQVQEDVDTQIETLFFNKNYVNPFTKNATKTI